MARRTRSAQRAARARWWGNEVNSGKIIRFGVFLADGYALSPDGKDMSAVEAGDAVQWGLLRENDSLSLDQAKSLAADWIRNARNLHLAVRVGESQRHYFGRDPFERPKFLGWA